MSKQEQFLWAVQTIMLANAVTIPLSSKACKELNEQANDDPSTLPDEE